MYAFRALLFNGGVEVKPIRGPQIDSSEMERTMKRFVGAPIFTRHERPPVRIGEVIDYLIDGKGDVYIGCALSTKGPRGALAAREIKSGELQGVSFGAKAIMNKKTGERFTDYKPTEVSLVKRGEEPRSRIMMSGDKSKVSFYASGINEISSTPSQLKPMSTQAAEGVLTAIEREDYNRVMAVMKEKGLGGNADEIKVNLEKNMNKLTKYETDAGAVFMEKMQALYSVFGEVVPREKGDPMMEGYERRLLAGDAEVIGEVEVLAEMGKSYSDIKVKYAAAQQEIETMKKNDISKPVQPAELTRPAGGDALAVQQAIMKKNAEQMSEFRKKMRAG